MTAKSSRKYEEQIRDKMRRMRKQGFSLQKIAAHYGVSRQTASVWICREDGWVAKKPVKRDTNGNGKTYPTNGKQVGKPRYCEETKQAARDMHKLGMSIAQIARLIGASTPAVRQWCYPEAAENRRKKMRERYHKDAKGHNRAVKRTHAKRRAVRDDALQNLTLRGLTYYYKGKPVATCPDDQAVAVIADIMNMIGRDGFPARREE